jgi:hypothetical protein
MSEKILSPYVHVLQVHGLGVCVPHVRNSALLGVPRTLVTSCSLMPLFSNRLLSRKDGAAGRGGGSGGVAHAVNTSAMMAILRAKLMVGSPKTPESYQKFGDGPSSPIL